MRRLILTLGLIITNLLPCYASIADCDSAIRAAGIPIDGVSGSGPSDPNLRVDCSQCTQTQSTQALSIAQNAANWTHIARNLPAFIQAMRTDPSTTPALRQNLALILPQVQMDYQNPAAMQQDWNDAVTTYGGTWLTPTVQNLILGYAATYHIPLTAGIQ